MTKLNTREDHELRAIELGYSEEEAKDAANVKTLKEMIEKKEAELKVSDEDSPSEENSNEGNSEEPQAENVGDNYKDRQPVRVKALKKVRVLENYLEEGDEANLDYTKAVGKLVVEGYLEILK